MKGRKRATVPTHDVNGRLIRATERAPSPPPPSPPRSPPPPPPPELIVIPPEIQSVHDMSFAPRETIFIDHTLERQLIQRHNERRQDVMQDMARILPYGYSYGAPWYNPFGKKEIEWEGDNVYEREMNKELHMGSRDYAIDTIGYVGSSTRSARHSPPRTILQPIARRDE